MTFIAPVVTLFTLVIIISSHEFASASNNCVTRHVGLADSEAYVGFLFSYKIPDEAFNGEISEFRVSEACEDTLPTWLTFDFSNRTFIGLPQAEDVGLVYICVKAVGPRSANDDTPCAAKDVFSIDVKIGLTPCFSCPEGQSVRLGNILTDVTLPHRTEQITILHSWASVLQIPEDSIRLTPLIRRYDPAKNPILFSGRGDSLQQINQGLRIQFQVGCSGDEITSEHRLVNFLKQTSATGELSRLVGYPVIEWEVLSGFNAGNRSHHAGSEFCSLHRKESTSADFSASDISFSTEPTELIPQKSNHEPVSDNKITKVVLAAGEVWVYVIPEDTFVDYEDGGTRNLHLTFTAEGQAVPSWIHFDLTTHTLSALPLENDIGRYEFLLVAMDNNGASATKWIQITVTGHRKSRRINHELIITLKDNHRSSDVIWQIEALNSLSQALGHNDTAFILVKSITFNPITIVWMNEDLLREPCPFGEINKLYSDLASEDGAPKERIENLMLPEFEVLKVELKFKDACIPGATPPKWETNLAPLLRNAIDKLDVTVGEVFRFKIPDDTFYDLEDGSTQNLLLTLHKSDTSEVSESSWIQFDSRSQEIYGVPGEENTGQNMYLLKATDSEGLYVSDSFVVRVQVTDRWRNPPVKFSITIDENFFDFNNNTRRKFLLAEKLSYLYGETDSGNLVILSVTEGSVVFTWTNKTLVKEVCPVDEIHKLSKFLVDDNCHPAVVLVKIMEPEFRVIEVNIALASVCAISEQKIKVDANSPADSNANKSADSPLLDATVLRDILSGNKPSESRPINCAQYELQPSTDSSATSATDTDTGEVAVEMPSIKANNQPIVKNRMSRFRLTSGKMWIHEVPEDIFEDPEDGSTRNLRLEFLAEERIAVTSDSWIHFDSETQVLSAFPTDEYVGRYQFILKASDNEGSAVEELVNIFVAHHHLTRRFNHEFTMTLNYNKKHHPVNISWQIKFIEKLARIIGHNDVNLITLRSVYFNPVRITWVNDNLSTHPCPFDDIRNIYSTLASASGTPTKQTANVMLPEFRIQKIELRFIGICENPIDP